MALARSLRRARRGSRHPAAAAATPRRPAPASTHRSEMKASSAKPQNMVRKRACRKPRRLSCSRCDDGCSTIHPSTCGGGRGGARRRAGGQRGPRAARQEEQPALLRCCCHLLLPQRRAGLCPGATAAAAHPRLHVLQRSADLQRREVPRVVRLPLRDAAAPQPLLGRAPAQGGRRGRRRAREQRAMPAASGAAAGGGSTSGCPGSVLLCPGCPSKAHSEGKEA